MINPGRYKRSKKREEITKYLKEMKNRTEQQRIIVVQREVWANSSDIS